MKKHLKNISLFLKNVTNFSRFLKTGKISQPAAKIPHLISSPNQSLSRSCTQSPDRGNDEAVSRPAGWQHGSHAGGSQPSLPATSSRNYTAYEISWSPALQDGSHQLRSTPSSASDISNAAESACMRDYDHGRSSAACWMHFWFGVRGTKALNYLLNHEIQIKSNQITFIVTSPQHKCLGE